MKRAVPLVAGGTADLVQHTPRAPGATARGQRLDTGYVVRDDVWCVSTCVHVLRIGGAHPVGVAFALVHVSDLT